MYLNLAEDLNLVRTPGQDSILSYATCTPRPQGLKIMMKSRDISSPDIGPGIRTQDSVVTSGTTTSYATEVASSAWCNLRGVTGIRRWNISRFHQLRRLNISRFHQHVVSEIADRQRRTSTTCCFSSLTTCFRCGTRTLSWIEPKNWW